MKITAPNRVQYTYRQRLDGTPDRIFLLLCPVREAEWAIGWQPKMVISSSGVAEPDCVFVTPASPADAIWYITRHEPEKLFVEMLKITPDETACRLQIQLIPADTGCFANVTYCHTSLGPAGDVFIARFTADYYRELMREWEKELNHYLKNGRQP